MRKLNLWLALFWSLLIGVACLMTFNVNMETKLPFKDKFVHFGFYLLFTILWFRFFDKKENHWNLNKKLLFVFLLGFVYGVGIEICQGLFTKTRSADIYDVVANTIGGITATMLLYFYKSREKRKLN